MLELPVRRCGRIRHFHQGRQQAKLSAMQEKARRQWSPGSGHRSESAPHLAGRRQEAAMPAGVKAPTRIRQLSARLFVHSYSNPFINWRIGGNRDADEVTAEACAVFQSEDIDFGAEQVAE